MSQSPSSDGKVTFEVAFDQLQVAVRKLESGELSLDESLKQFEEGVKLTRVCQEYLSAAEQRVELLAQASADGNVDLKPFPPQKS
jgi:exodeoxyribonuclease VII small subunit